LNILIKNIRQLVQVEKSPAKKVSGKSMGSLPSMENAWLSIKNGLIYDFGTMDQFKGVSDWSDLEVIDATGKMVFPSWCDSHTHLVYAGSRESEFEGRVKGLSYEEIASKGGGILNSATKLAQTDEAELYDSAMRRLNEIAAMGTGAVEIKSGYGLTVEAELKILRVIKKLKEDSALTIKSTFLGAHAYPAQYKKDHKGYMDLIIKEMLPAIDKEGLADYIDVFCETNYFSPNETDTILQAGAQVGLKPKIHVNQFTSIGGIQVGVKNKAISVDHLEILENTDLESLKGAETMATLLPSCSFFLNIPYAPGRKMIDAGLGIALATDFNPGSTPSGNIPFVLSLACIKMGLTPEEAINGATVNGAYAMELSSSHGSIAKGKKANVFITREMPSIAYLPYSFGTNLIETVILQGKIHNH
jgi:imidazolonepropionase